MAGTASADAIWKDMQTRGVEFVFAQFVDMYARPSAKLVPVGSRDAFDGLLEEGAGFAGFAAGEIGQMPSDPDIAAIPDLRSYTPVPWQPNLARFACDVTVEGEGWPYCPRTILRRVLARAEEKGVAVRGGLGDRRRADGAGRAGPVLDDHLLAERLAEGGRDGARGDVDVAARRPGHDDAQRLARKLLRVRRDDER